MSISIVQSAHAVLGSGSGSFAFASPTQVGNTVIVVRIWLALSSNNIVMSDSDNGGNEYGDYFSGDLITGGQHSRVEIFAAFNPNSGSPVTPSLSMQTFSQSFSSGTSFVSNNWMFEVSGLSGRGIASLLFGGVIPSNTGVPPTADTSLPVYQQSGGIPSPGTSINDTLLIAGVSPFTPAVASVNTPWTLAPVQNSIGVAYQIIPAGVSFTEEAIFGNGVTSSTYSGTLAGAFGAASPPSGTIIVNKVTNPPGSPQSFAFRPNWKSSFNLSDGGSNSSALTPGTYSITEDAVAGFNTVATVDNGDPISAINLANGQTRTVTFTNTLAPPPCAAVDISGRPVDGVFIDDLNLFIIPAYSLYENLVPNSAIAVNEVDTQGRKQIILDFNNNEGLYVRDFGTIFTWSLQAGTILDVWQPSVIPMDGEIYDRLSYHCLMTSLGSVGWQHTREMNIAYAAPSPLTLLLVFDQWPNITLTLPSSVSEIKQKLTLPPNKFKLVEIFLSSAQPFKLWTNDLEMKVKTWGSNEPYRVARPVSG